MITDAALYLPITERTIAPILDVAESFSETIAGLSVAEVSALILLQYLPALKEKQSRTLDSILAQAIHVGNAQLARDGSLEFNGSVARALDREKISAGYQLISDFAIELLDEQALARREFLTVDGEWDSSFRNRHKAWLIGSLHRINLESDGYGILTLEQSRIFREVRAQADDHLHVQGYAGTGKSHLIKSILSMLRSTSAKILVLAERQRQLEALLAGTDRMGHVFPRRFDSLASEMTPPDLTDPVNRRMRSANQSSAPMSDEKIIRHLGITSSGQLLASDIVKVVRGTLVGFCHSGEHEIEADHIPKWSEASLDATAKQVVLHHATELWKATLSPQSRDFQPPIRGYHRIKWAALNEWRIPARYTHVLIDECHNLAKPMSQILDCSPQAVISLGDEYQNLQGRPLQRSDLIRHRAVTQSVRSGRLVESVVNPIIGAHPGKTKLEFRGNPLNKTEILRYDNPMIPDRPTAVLVSDTWGLFEWAQRLATENLEIELMSSIDNLNMFVSDCIELYQNRTRPRHGELFRFASWDAVAGSHHENQGFQRIDRMLKKGYSFNDWMKTSSKFVARSAGGYSLGTIEDVRNREFESVLLVPETVDGVRAGGKAEIAAIGSAIYVAVTRAQRKLIIPEKLSNWIEDISPAAGRA